jgi:hypothetical protein
MLLELKWFDDYLKEKKKLIKKKNKKNKERIPSATPMALGVVPPPPRAKPKNSKTVMRWLKPPLCLS